MKNITEVILKVGGLLAMEPGQIEITQSPPGIDTVIEWDDAKCIIKPVIGTHRLEFRTPDNSWGWEIGCAYSEMPGAILAGLQIIKRIPSAA